MPAVVPPKHLRPLTRQWFASVASDFDLEQQHVRLLTLACECWDRCEQAREALASGGLTFTNRNGCPRPRPEVQIERASRADFSRLLRELGLSSQPEPAEGSTQALKLHTFR